MSQMMENIMLSRLYTDVHCNCLVFDEGKQPRELAGLRYSPFTTIENRRQIADQEVLLFDLNRSPYSRTISADHVPTSYIKSRFDDYCKRGIVDNLGTLEMRTIYRPIPVNWAALRSLNIGPVRGNESHQVVYEEDGNCDEITEGDIQYQAEYKNELTKQLRFSFLFKNLKMQKALMGVYQLPSSVPRNAMPRNDSWFNDFSWLDNITSTLPEWVSLINNSAINDIKEFIQSQKRHVMKFKSDMQLENTSMWLDDLQESRAYVEHLKLYVDMVNILFCTTFRGLESALHVLNRTQIDLATVSEKIIQR